MNEKIMFTNSKIAKKLIYKIEAENNQITMKKSFSDVVSGFDKQGKWELLKLKATYIFGVMMKMNISKAVLEHSIKYMYYLLSKGYAKYSYIMAALSFIHYTKKAEVTQLITDERILGMFYHNYGRICYSEGRYSGAKEHFNAVFNILEQVKEFKTEKEEIKEKLAISLIRTDNERQISKHEDLSILQKIVFLIFFVRLKDELENAN